MFWMKMLGCVLVITSCTGFGVYFSCVIKCRLEELIELKKIIVLLRGNIRYANTPLAEAFRSIASRHDGEFKPFLIWVSKRLEDMEGYTVAQIWKEGIDTQLKGLSLSKKDKESLNHFGTNLGYLDRDMQLNTIDLFITTLEIDIEELSKTVKERSYLYNSLGVMTGIFITIMMI